MALLPMNLTLVFALLVVAFQLNRLWGRIKKLEATVASLQSQATPRT